MVNEVKHPLILHKLSILRNIKTNNKEFRELVNEITTLLAYEALKNIELDDIKVETPLTVANGKKIKNDLVIVPILRAGIGMLEGIINLLPTAKVAFVGIYRDHITKEPVEYYEKFPEKLSHPIAFVIDPMLATGGSIVATINLIKKRGIDNIKIISILSSPEGIDFINKNFNDIDIYTASIDEYLNNDKYIIPGLGDAGDRLFGT